MKNEKLVVLNSCLESVCIKRSFRMWGGGLNTERDLLVFTISQLSDIETILISIKYC